LIPNLHRKIPQSFCLFRGTKKGKQIPLFYIVGKFLVWLGLASSDGILPFVSFGLSVSISLLVCLETDSSTNLMLVIQAQVISQTPLGLNTVFTAFFCQSL
jgi:hypothetical protein